MGSQFQGKKVYNFKKYYALYTLLKDNKRYDKEMRDAIIKTMTKSQLKGLDEAVHIALNDTSVPIDSKDLKKLKRYKKHLREFQANKNKHANQKKIISQKGGFLTALIPVLTGILGTVAAEGVSAIAGAIKRHRNKKKK